MATPNLYKTVKLAVAAALTTLVALPTAFSAVGFQTTFDGLPTYLEAGLSDQNGWVTNDPFDGTNGGSDFVGGVGFYGSNTDFVGQLGGIYLPSVPNQSNVTLGQTFGAIGALDGLRFTVDFAITSSTSGFAKDSFGFAIKIGGISYATLLFTPQTNTVWDGVGSPLNTNNKLNITLSGAASASSPQALVYNNLTSLSVNIDLAGLLTATLDGVGLFPGGVLLPSGSLLAQGTTGIDVQWNLANPSINGTPQVNAGNNSIVFDNVYVVPEPSTVGLAVVAGIGGLILVMRRRKTA